MLRGFSMAGVTLATVLHLAACGGSEGGDSMRSGTSLSGQVQIDGSSTVFPIQEAIAEEFQAANPGVRVSVGISGTGGGFKRFCAGETDISDASRPMKQSEIDACAAAGIEFTELPLAWDGLSVIASPANDFAQCLTVDELRRIWEPGSKVSTWRDVRAEWPAEAIKLYGPGTDSGTFDYFTETVMGESGASRPDYQASEDDNILVQGVSGDRYSLGYFGYAYFTENQSRLKLLQVDGGTGCVAPSDQTIADGTYAPLSRPLFVYVNHASVTRPEIKGYLEFLVSNAHEVVPSTGYHALTPEEYGADMAKLAALTGASN
ncbi:MAG TPA: PstS family phosphate ABC transporter substrate-binding protein [Longimicrobiales bacterium]|nr:PstS family phosphate ABC transporter substrate-binding protein [Longimicrobiales bacterium]